MPKKAVSRDAEHAKEDRVRNEKESSEFLEKLARGCVNDDVVLQTVRPVTRSPFLVIGMADSTISAKTGRAHDFTVAPWEGKYPRPSRRAWWGR